MLRHLSQMYHDRGTNDEECAATLFSNLEGCNVN